MLESLGLLSILDDTYIHEQAIGQAEEGNAYLQHLRPHKMHDPFLSLLRHLRDLAYSTPRRCIETCYTRA